VCKFVVSLARHKTNSCLFRTLKMGPPNFGANSINDSASNHPISRNPRVVCRALRRRLGQFIHAAYDRKSVGKMTHCWLSNSSRMLANKHIFISTQPACRARETLEKQISEQIAKASGKQALAFFLTEQCEIRLAT